MTTERLIPAGWVRAAAIALGLVGIVLPFATAYWLTQTTTAEQVVDSGDLRPEMVVVPVETYTLGQPEVDRSEFEGPLRTVTLRTPFAISVTEVTRAQYERVTGVDPSTDRDCGPDCPVTNVSWLDAVKYMNQLSESDPMVEPCYRIEGDDVTLIGTLQSCTGYRLPTEAEWEVAARAGTTDRYGGTNDPGEVCRFANVDDARRRAEVANDPPWEPFLCDDGFADLAPVRQFDPNALGLYDMTGNVWEWVWDWYESDVADASDPARPKNGLSRVVRGGSFYDGPRGARVANRYLDFPSWRFGFLGFRVARSWH